MAASVDAYDMEDLRGSIRFLCRGLMPLSFKDAGQEQRFRKQQDERTARQLMTPITSIGPMIPLVVWIRILLDFIQSPGSCTCAVRSVGIAILTIYPLLLRIRWIHSRHSMIVLIVCLALGALPATSLVRACSLCGDDITQMVVAGQDSPTSDTFILLPIVFILFLTVQLPIPSTYSLIFYMSTPVTYAAWTFVLPPGLEVSNMRRALLTGMLLAFCLLAFIQKLFAETSERVQFELMQLLQKDLTREKVLRFSAEHEAERAQGPANTAIRCHETQSVSQSVVSSHPETTISSAIYHGLRALPDNELSWDLLENWAKNEGWHIPEDALHCNFLETLGRGGFGGVFKGSYASTDVAIKVSNFSRDVANAELYNELRLLRSVKHPNIVACFGACIFAGKQAILLVEEFVAGGDLCQLASVRPPDSVQSRIIFEISSALRYLHSLHPPIIHGDLKPNNIMLVLPTQQPKLIDFGLARHGGQERNRLGGTKMWMAPEILLRTVSKPLQSADIFSFGTVVYFILTGNRMSDHISWDDLKSSFKEGCVPDLPWPQLEDDECSLRAKCQMFCDSCRQFAPDSRPKTDNVYEKFKHIMLDLSGLDQPGSSILQNLEELETKTAESACTPPLPETRQL